MIKNLKLGKKKLAYKKMIIGLRSKVHRVYLIII